MIKTLKNLFKQDKERFLIPNGVQDVIPIRKIYDDGVFQVGDDKFSKTYKFTDINYAVAVVRTKRPCFSNIPNCLIALTAVQQRRLLLIIVD